MLCRLVDKHRRARASGGGATPGHRISRVGTGAPTGRCRHRGPLPTWRRHPFAPAPGPGT